MLELYIPIVKSDVVSMENKTCDVEPQPAGFRIAYNDGSSDRESRCSEFGNENPNYSFDDVMWPDETNRTPPLLQPPGMNRGRGESRDEYMMGLQNREEKDYRVQEYREDQQYKDHPNQSCGKKQSTDESYRGRDDWEVDRPPVRQRHQGRGDRYTEDAEDHHHERKSVDSGSRRSKALQSYGATKKFTICELLKARQKNKKTKKAFQALMELKQSMGSRMSGSFFQRSGHGHDGAAHGGEHDAFPRPGNATKAKSEYETFTLSLIPELKKLNDQQMRQFKWKVFQLIDDITAGSDSNTSFDKRGGKQVNRFGSDQSGSVVQDVYQAHFDQDFLVEPVLTDQSGDRDGQWWDRETSRHSYQQQGHPLQQQRQPHQQSKQSFRSQQHYQTHQQPWQQHQQPHEPQCEPQHPHHSYNKHQLPHRPHCEPQPPCQPHCQPPQPHQRNCEPHQPRHSHCEPPPSHQPHCEPQPTCQPRCEPQPPCQPCCEPQKRHSKNGDPEHRPSEASDDSHHKDAQSNRSSYHTADNSSRAESPSRRVHYE